MKVSIAMATYNGEKYLWEQLESFLRQTRLPDELVVCDDCSTDHTVDILEDFVKIAPFPVCIFQNEANLGYSGNFGRAISLCQGDVIFLSDQDDVWFPEKIEIVLRAFRETHSLVVINNALLTEESLKPVGLTIVDQIRYVGFPLSSFVHGCCTAFRSELLRLLLPIPPEVAFDSWVHCLGAILNRRFILLRPLQYYRRHGKNTSDWIGNKPGKIGVFDYISSCRKENPRTLCAQRLKMLETMLERLAMDVSNLRSLAGDNPDVEGIFASIREEVEAVKRRLNLLQSNKVIRFFLGLRMLGRGEYKRYFTGWKSFVKDLLW